MSSKAETLAKIAVGVLAAVAKNGESLQFVPKALKADKEFMLAVIAGAPRPGASGANAFPTCLR